MNHFLCQKHLRSLVMITLGWILCTMPQFVLAQNFDTEFGKNRVQFHDNFKYWSKYDTDNFTVYWYGRGKNVAHLAVQMAEMDHDEIRKLIEHKINDKIEILVYVDIADLKQNNIGNEQTFESKSGETKIVGNKMFVYFDGNHQNLRKQIREGIASVYLNHLLFGSNFQEIVQNAVLLELDEWFKVGLIGFAGSYWNMYVDDELRDILYKEEKSSDFKSLAQKYPKAIGHSFWYFISEVYGRSVIANLLYLTRISRDVESTFQFVLNKSIPQIQEEWTTFFAKKYALEDGVFQNNASKNKLTLSNKPHIPVSHLSVSPDGQKLAFIQNELGQLRLKVHDFKSKKDKTVFKYSFKNRLQETDYNYAHIFWDNDGEHLFILYQHREKIYLRRLNTQTQKYEQQLMPNDFQRICSIAPIDGRHFLLSAAIEGLSDLFIYDSKERAYLRITDDIYDDLDASYVTYEGENGILFSSNRPHEHILPQKLDTILPLQTFNIFFYPTSTLRDEFAFKKQDKRLYRITSGDIDNHRHPISISNSSILYLSEETGMRNLFINEATNGEDRQLTNYDRNIIRHSFEPKSNRYVYTLYNEGAYEVYQIKDINLDSTANPYITNFKKSLLKRLEATEEVNKDQNEKKVEPIKPEYYFQSNFPDPQPLEPIKEIKQKVEKVNLKTQAKPLLSIQEQPKSITKIDNTQITASRLQFRLADFTTRLDNEVLFEGLELFQGQNPQVNQLPMGILAKATVMDLFEDYRFEGGVRIPTTFNGSEYFLIFDNRKKLLDKRIAAYRRVITENPEVEFLPLRRSKKETLLGLYQVKYPFDIYTSIRATGSIRMDRTYFRSTDSPTFNAPVINDKRLGLKLEYIYDNTYEYQLNILHGTRYKFYIEGFNEFNIQVQDGFNFDLSRGTTGVIGFDARHYIPVLQHSLLAIRGVGASSFGSKKNVYFLGGVNNALFANFNNDIPIPQGDDFAFKTNAPHLRGFLPNIRNGSTFLLANAELRIPVFTYLLGRGKGTAFFRHMQFAAFVDGGLAWYGSSPYSRENPLNTTTINSPVLDLEIEYFRDPLVVGYGFGVRTKVLGYFLKLDYGRGIETRTIQPGRFHLSLGLDF